MAAKLMGVKAVIVMPRITPDIKVQAVRARGAKVVQKVMPLPPPSMPRSHQRARLHLYSAV